MKSILLFRRSIITVLLFFLANHIMAQQAECTFSRLSHLYTYHMVINKQADGRGTVSVTITRSGRPKGQVISFTPDDWFALEYNCSSRSFITGYNKNKDAVDGEFGDLIVADLNFDGREDFAVRDEFTNGYGSLYKFYIQGIDGVFREIKDDMGGMYERGHGAMFPVEIDHKNRMLHFWNRAGAVQGVNTYVRYYPAAHTWKKWEVVRDNYANGKIIRSVEE